MLKVKQPVYLLVTSAITSLALAILATCALSRAALISSAISNGFAAVSYFPAYMTKTIGHAGW